jgi:hypothetical protein
MKRPMTTSTTRARPCAFPDQRPSHPTPRHQTSLPLQALADEEDDRPAAKMQKVAPPQQGYRGPLAHQVSPAPPCHGA